MLRRTRLTLGCILVFLPVLVLLSAGHLAAQGDPLLPLAGHGTYVAGIRTLDYVDAARSDRPVTISLWYPGIMPAEKLDKVPILQKSNTGFPNLPPDLSGAPYPVVLFSHRQYSSGRDSFSIILEPLVTHGFVVVTIQHANDRSMLTLVDRPLDIRFVLDQLEEVNASGEMAGLMNLERVGLIGDHDGASAAIAMSGAQIDEAFMSQWGTDKPDMTDPRIGFPDWSWDALKAYYEQFFPPAEGGFWQPMSDPRIVAAVAYQPCHMRAFGEGGLGMATVPILLIAATKDDYNYCPYEYDAVFAYEHLGSPTHDLLTLVVGWSGPPVGDWYTTATTHYTAAFFTYMLTDQTDYAVYFTEDYVKQFDKLAWGVYSGS